MLALGGSCKTLDASGNRLARLPPAFVQLCALQRLALSNNALASLPAELLAPSLANTLRVLLLDGNALTALPLEALGRLTRLEKASFARCKLTGPLPHSVEWANLVNLKTLDLSHNRITGELPAGLAGCRSLEELDASHNALQSVAGSLGGLQRLRSLVLDGNCLATLPVELLQGVPSLTQLSLHDQQPPLLVDALRALPGWAEVEKRTAGRNAKKVAGGVIVGRGGLDDGVDHGLHALLREG